MNCYIYEDSYGKYEVTSYLFTSYFVLGPNLQEHASRDIELSSKHPRPHSLKCTRTKNILRLVFILTIILTTTQLRISGCHTGLQAVAGVAPRSESRELIMVCRRQNLQTRESTLESKPKADVTSIRYTGVYVSPQIGLMATNLSYILRFPIHLNAQNCG